MADKEKENGAAKPATEKKREHFVHKNVFAALSAFQGELKPIEKDGSVKFKTKSDGEVDFNYTTLGKTMEVIYPLLASHGLSVRWELGDGNVEAILTHETADQKEVENKDSVSTPENTRTQTTKVYLASNEVRSGKLPIDAKKTDMKEVGAQITYARRYTLGLVLGLATEEDKDAQLITDKLASAQTFAYTRAKKGIEDAKDEKTLEQATDVLKKDVERLRNNQRTSLGLEESQYEELLTLGEDKAKELVETVNGAGDKSNS